MQMFVCFSLSLWFFWIRLFLHSITWQMCFVFFSFLLPESIHLRHTIKTQRERENQITEDTKDRHFSGNTQFKIALNLYYVWLGMYVVCKRVFIFIMLWNLSSHFRYRPTHTYNEKNEKQTWTEQLNCLDLRFQ